MKILFWQWHSFMGKGMERALHRLNIAYDTFFYQMNDWESDDWFAEQLEKRISQQAYDAVISVNFNPVISDVCQNHKLPYRAWVYDSPIHIRNVQALKNSYTKVYSDKILFASLNNKIRTFRDWKALKTGHL